MARGWSGFFGRLKLQTAVHCLVHLEPTAWSPLTSIFPHVRQWGWNHQGKRYPRSTKRILISLQVIWCAHTHTCIYIYTYYIIYIYIITYIYICILHIYVCIYAYWALDLGELNDRPPTIGVNVQSYPYLGWCKMTPISRIFLSLLVLAVLG